MDEQVRPGHQLPATAKAPPSVPQPSEAARIPSFETLDRLGRAVTARLTQGISPHAIYGAWFDWASHLVNAPGRLIELGLEAGNIAARYAHFSSHSLSEHEKPPFEPQGSDHRFADDAWKHFPYVLWQQAFLAQEAWWRSATREVRGMTPKNADRVAFMTHQLLDIWSPSNIPWLNPVVIERTLHESGANLVRGASNFQEDFWRRVTLQPEPAADGLEVGRDLAITPGTVVYRNDLIELIQYQPSGDNVVAEPVLIVPAWIMKYYVLDLRPQNSLVRYLVGRGFTVFMVSWRNPTATDRDLTFDAYRTQGVMAALDAVTTIVPNRKVNAVGYCIGGTLLAIAAATMARDGDDRLGTISLLAAQTDFCEAGELMLFVDESQIAFLEDMMWDQGVLDTQQMAGAFQILRSNDLVWSKMVREYVLGERDRANDLTAWNADQTRMPPHAFGISARPVPGEPPYRRPFRRRRPRHSAARHRAPMFVVGTEKDHIAPWRSVYKLHLFTNTDVTFVLTTGGHNAGIVSEPGHRGRHYVIATRKPGDRYVDPDTWRALATPCDGSWWPAWASWLEAHSDQTRVPPPGIGAPTRGLVPLWPAPGLYVLQS